MSRVKNPVNIASHFKIEPGVLKDMGVVNVILNADTQLFIDPLLLPHSCHEEIYHGASESYNRRFEEIIKLLSHATDRNDVVWKTVKRKFKFSEISWTCLGYSSGPRGSGFGDELVEKTLNTAHRIVELGVKDVDLFMALGLFEEGIGADRISDMTTNIIIDDLANFTTRVNKTLSIPTRKVKHGMKEYDLPFNTFANKPLLFVPTDIVRDLPIANSASDIARISRENDDFREAINTNIGNIFAQMNRKQKDQLKRNALSSKENFDIIIELINKVPPEPYDLLSDKKGELFWMDLYQVLTERVDRNSTKHSNKLLQIEDVKEIVDKILIEFTKLVEDKGLWKQLWIDDKNHKREKAAQGLFFAVADSYCKANNLDLTPEADLGNGPVDFKFSQGQNSKVLVEVKLSSNSAVKHGYEKQLEIYKIADETSVGYFLLIDVGHMGKKHQEIQKIRDEKLAKNESASKIFLVDATQKASASKRA